jgi:hypothetical protein
VAAPYCDKFGLHESGGHSAMVPPQERRSAYCGVRNQKYLVSVQEKTGRCMETMLLLIRIFASGITSSKERALSQKNIHKRDQTYQKRE